MNHPDPSASQTARILVIDDDEGMCYTLTRMAEEEGRQAQAASTLSQGLELVHNGEYDVVFLDVRLPDGSGLPLIPVLRATAGSPEVIILTGFGEPDGAELAIQSGAWDYVEKSSSWNEVSLSLIRALRFREGRQGPESDQAPGLDTRGVVAASPQMKACLGAAATAAAAEGPVLITGPTGTGKEVFSRMIHRSGPRKAGPFVVVDCAALPPSLVESSLFGHLKGSFTGARHDQKGLVTQAHGGSLFLDEVGELPAAAQKSFLRVLDTGSYRPLGAEAELASDFRLIAATNRDLNAEAAKGRFRQDLLFRLRSFHLEIPPLARRPDDVRALAVHYLKRLCAQEGLAPKGLSPDLWNILTRYHWPGNVRELVAVLEHAVAASGQAPTLYPWHLPPSLRIHAAKSSLAAESASGAGRGKTLPTWRQAKLDLEASYLRELMSLCEGNVKEASRISGLSVPRLYELLRKHRLAKGKV
jgi:two-component system NtrC family response regulator